MCSSCYNNGIIDNAERASENLAVVNGKDLAVEVGTLMRMEEFKVEGKPESAEWACGVCSLINVGSELRCTVWLSSRPTRGEEDKEEDKEEDNSSGKKRAFAETEEGNAAEPVVEEPIFNPYADLIEHVVENTLKNFISTYLAANVEENRSQIELLVKLTCTDDEKFVIRVVEKLIECAFLRDRQDVLLACGEVRVCEERSDELRRRVYWILTCMVDTSVRNGAARSEATS